MVLANIGFPPDLRVEKEARCLTEAGHDVWLLARARSGEHSVERLDDITVVRHRVHKSLPLRRKFDSLRYLVTLDSPSWRRQMERLVREHSAQVLHLHDLPYAKSVIRAARTCGVPVVIDLHENYPAALALWQRRRLDRLLFSPARAARLEKWAVREADRIVVVVEEARQRVISLGADPAKVVVFGNAEPRALAEPQPEPLPDKLAIVYVGGVARHRGLHTAIAAMPKILSARPDATLTIVGDGAVLGDLRALAGKLGVSGAVRFTGKLPFDQAMQVIRESSVATVPHIRSPHTDATVPHKLFQYMALGRPVLVSDCAPLARIVGATHSGEVFSAENPDDFAEKALLLADPARAAAAATAGRAAALDGYNLEADAPALTGMYAGLAGSAEL